VPHLLRHGTSVFEERPVILTSEWRALGDGAITTYFKLLMLNVASTSGAVTHDLPNAKQEHNNLTTATSSKISNMTQ
jgi:hypothetical protein